MRIAHLSDPHLISSLASAPAASLDFAFQLVQEVDPRPDCVVITGDLADSGHPDEYAALRQVLERSPIPVHLVVGSHDDRDALLGEFAGSSYLGDGKSTYYSVDYPEATVIVADSLMPGSKAGYLGDEQLEWIDAVLAQRPGVPAFLCVHHTPVPVGMPYLDSLRLADGPELAEVIAKHGNVSRVLCGHIHRAISAPFAGTQMSVAPSTYRQTMLRLKDDKPPGYLDEPPSFLLHLDLGDVCVTHTVAVDHDR